MSFPETKWGLFLLETQKDTDAKNGNVSCTKLSGSRGSSLYPQVIAWAMLPPRHPQEDTMVMSGHASGRYSTAGHVNLLARRVSRPRRDDREPGWLLPQQDLENTRLEPRRTSQAGAGSSNPQPGGRSPGGRTVEAGLSLPWHWACERNC